MPAKRKDLRYLIHPYAPAIWKLRNARHMLSQFASLLICIVKERVGLLKGYSKCGDIVGGQSKGFESKRSGAFSC